jgi:hypothetical protein
MKEVPYSKIRILREMKHIKEIVSFSEILCLKEIYKTYKIM